MKTNYGLAQWAQDWLTMPYWYGCVCYQCTDELLSRKAKQYPKHYTSERMERYESDIAAGKWAADCIGLAKGYMWWDAQKGGARYASNGCPDLSANGMHYAAEERGDMDTLPEMPGIMLWKSGHAGIYIGDGWAVEERGFDYGCVKTKVKERGWQGWYKLPGLTYSDQDDGQGRETPPFKVEREEETAQTGDIVITGERVNLRYGPGTDYAAARTVSKGTVLHALDNPDGWRAVESDGGVRWVSPKYSEVVV